MTNIAPPYPPSLISLGWSTHFADQLTADDAGAEPMRIASVHRAKMRAQSSERQIALSLSVRVNTSDYAVGDWVLVEPGTGLLLRRLDRQSLLQRRTQGARTQQLIAANVDTLFIATSCNEDFNPARLERYLALANEAQTTPVIVLTKRDQVDDIAPFIAQASALQRDLPVVAVDGTSDQAVSALAPWCAPGQTVALIGSSGVGKSTLLNTLTGKTPDDEDAQLTGGIREDDAKGRHTTTARSLHQMPGAALVIDTPGMRTLHVSDIGPGIDAVFSEISERAADCHFRNCTHAHEPGCAVQAAVVDGTVTQARLDRWRKLTEENEKNTPVETGPRGNKTARKRGRR
ncbi:ribosome small subunit-dependent GTPase A [Thioclava sp. SK-1]|uniref:ribosome small subunit-dependent GTPase A n=1 Tax=Thioclava sp. SK-1 TaxID=1889770 RepID=UPI000825C0DA|nr:ribosome small subunit-dependent GTPase A [Thioclava sp. SK-1]OCX62328.1 ribosome small subunit-dependent GTPase A [Thioclava sp. SK-1]